MIRTLQTCLARFAGALIALALCAVSPVSSAQSAATDPDFASVQLLLHMDGTDGSTTFTDVSKRSKKDALPP